jgi:hypothetical protein
MLFHSLLIYIKLKTISFLRHYASSSFPGRAAREKRFFLPYNASLPLSLLEIKKIPTQPKLMAHHEMKK